MSTGVQLLIAAVIVLAAWIVTHIALVARVRGVTQITTRQRWIAALVPIATPWLGWKTGKRKHVVLWACLIVLYALLRAALR